MKFKDYYKILELDTSRVTIEQIKIAYRKQAKKYHPDVNVGDKLAEEKIKDINEAYRILSQPSTKRKYDRTWNYNVGRLKRAKQKTSGEMAGEFFEMFFGNSDMKEEIPEAKLKPQKGENIETGINISLEDGQFVTYSDNSLLFNKQRTIYTELNAPRLNGSNYAFHIGKSKWTAVYDIPNTPWLLVGNGSSSYLSNKITTLSIIMVVVAIGFLLIQFVLVMLNVTPLSQTLDRAIDVIKNMTDKHFNAVFEDKLLNETKHTYQQVLHLVSYKPEKNNFYNLLLLSAVCLHD